ncbi:MULTISPECIES: alpha/beta fold hydrolase [Sorangium]|uniref:Epoxide hydrolase n=1 Tax=Sorangium cellulosum (strain So ce56) TaxID=448385 RepID=A9GRP4_SORC5|nr:alpha/beta hydrolase [Sorangium cellulosum]CAN93652.1 Epoxide hydrolase [Sorangium cellulosum So ce56]
MTEESYFNVNGVRLHVVSAGPATGKPVVLLHGFPDHWYGWRHQIGPLAERGYRVIVPDQRGYNLSEKPSGTDSYKIARLAGDVIGILDALALDRVSLVGHDWGGAVAWWVAANHVERVERLAILNCPHFSTFQRALLSFEQFKRSWYIYLFQIPHLAEALCRLEGYSGLVKLGLAARPGTFSERELASYFEAWGRPDAMRGMLSWYRALGREVFSRFPRTQIDCPVLLLWGARDPFLSASMVEPSMTFCKDGRSVLFKDETHWLHWEAPERVNGLLLEWIEQG